MKYMVAFRLKPGHKEQVLKVFDQVGPNRNEGVVFRNAWVGSHSDIAFVLVEAENENRLTEAAKSWSEHGEMTMHAVVDIDDV